jgi:hypothetical protein
MVLVTGPPLRLVRGPRDHRQPAQVKPHALPADPCADGSGGPRIPHGRLQPRPRGDGDGPAAHAGGERVPVRAVEPHTQREPVAWVGAGLGQAHPVAAVNGVERRDVELFRYPGPAAGVGMQEVGVPLAVGVVHLGHHAFGPVTPVHGERVEHVTQYAGLRQHRDRVGSGDAIRGQEAVEVLPDAAARVAKVVTSAEAGQQPDPGQVVEVDQPQVAAVAEHVAQGGRTRVADRDLIQRVHQAPPDARAAAAPDRQPSSWNPQPW